MAKSKVIAQDGEVYIPPLHLFFFITRVYGKRSREGGLYTSLFCVIIPTLFPYFLLFWYPYILLHFPCFYYLSNFVMVIFVCELML